MENLFVSFQSLFIENKDVAILLSVFSIGVLAWTVNVIAVRLSSRIRTPWSPYLERFLSSYSLLLLWFLGLVILDANLGENEPGHRLLSASESLVGILILVRLIFRWIPTKSIARLIAYSIVPLIVLNTFDLLDSAIKTLDSYALNIGNIHISLYDVLRILFFGVILFWVGRESNRVGKQKIRQQKNLDSRTKEITAKLFEVGLYVFIFLILLNIMGINLTTLAVVGGAIGVGVGFGLQSIASNFMSGLIILLDRSLSIGDFIELSDGRNGLIRELNLRAVTLETFDGKDIVVPNDVFFSETFTNWTHKNKKQRYAIDFSVAYATDLDHLFPLVKTMLAEHPQVLSGEPYPIEEQPDIEISGFGDNGIDLHIEFWMEAIDDGENRVGGDLLFSLWKLMKTHGFEFPFPQREVRILEK